MKNTKKNIIPVIAVLVLIVIIILFMLLGRLIEKYTPSKEHQELSEYYGLASDDSVALIFNNEVLSVQGRLIDGNVYLDFETVHDKINSRFFWDANENKLLYTTATDLISADAESTTYYVTKDARTLDHTIVKADASTAYIAIDFVKQYSDFDYTVYDQPNRVVLTTSGATTTPLCQEIHGAALSGQASRVRLADLAKGTVLTVLEPDETWTKVMTEDGIIRLCKDPKPRQHLHRDPDQRLHCGRIFAY